MNKTKTKSRKIHNESMQTGMLLSSLALDVRIVLPGLGRLDLSSLVE